MKMIAGVIRIAVSMAFAGLAFKYFTRTQALLPAWAAVCLGLIILFPVLRSWLLKPAASLPRTKSTFNGVVLLRYTRKAVAIFCCFAVVGGFKNGYYEASWMIAGICLLLLSPLDAIVFGPVGLSNSRLYPDWRAPLVLLARNMGWALYVTAIFLHIDEHHFDPQLVYSLLITGGVLLLMRPIVLLFGPLAAAPATEEEPPKDGQQPEAPKEIGDAKEPLTSLEEQAPIVVSLAVAPIPEAPVTESSIVAHPPVPTYGDKIALLKLAYQQLAQLPVQRRGYAFQDFLNDLFTAHDIVARGSFRLKGEEIDGSFDIGAQTYLLEAKWQASLTSQSDLLIFNSKVEGKSTWARGLFVSHAGFGHDGLYAFGQGKRTSIIGMNGDDLQLILDGHITLVEAIRRKAIKAVENNAFFVPLTDLL